MRKTIVGLGAAAAVMLSGGSKADTRDWVRRQSAGSAAITHLPFLLQGTIVAQGFANAKTIEDFKAAEAIWIMLRPNLAKYETSLNCKDYGSSHDNEIAIDLVEELIKKPLGLTIDSVNLLQSLAGGENDDSLESLKSAMKDLVVLAKDKGVEKAMEHVAARGKIIERFKEALLRYLQANSKRSRTYFLQIIADVGAIAKGYGGLTLKIGEIALTPSRINPEECGSEMWIESERDSAIRRIFSSRSL